MAVKTGMSIQELAAEVMRQERSKEDWRVGSNRLSSFTSATYGTRLSVDSKGPYSVTEYGHGTISQWLGIPKAYYDRMRGTQPDLLDQNINAWIRSRSPEEKRLVRVLDGSVRAVLSNSYRILDNSDLLKFIFPELMEFAGLRYESMQLTETRLYLKMVLPSLEEQVTPGNWVSMGAVIRNSEVRASELVAEGWVVVRSAAGKSGISVPEWGQRRRHVRRATLGGDDSDVQEYYSDEATQAEDLAFFLKVRDTVRMLFTEDVFGKIVHKMREAAGMPVMRPESAVAVLAKKAALTDDERSNVLDFLVKGGDLSMWGLAQAISQQAGETDGYERATELEMLSGALLNLPMEDTLDIAHASAKDAARAQADRALVVVA